MKFQDKMTKENIKEDYNELMSSEDQMFLIHQEMRAIQCGGGSRLNYKEILDKDLRTIYGKDKRKDSDPLCMNCRYAPAKHLP